MPTMLDKQPLTELDCCVGSSVVYISVANSRVSKMSLAKSESEDQLDSFDITELERRKTAAELKKLNREIDDLKRKSKFRQWFLEYSPLVTVLVAIGGFLWGIYQFKAQQKEQQARTIVEQQRGLSVRIQDQIRTDLDQLLHFTNDKQQTVSRVLFLLEELKDLLHYPISDTQRMSDIFPGQERAVTQSLVGMIDNDCDFKKGARDVNFTSTVIDHWNCYSEYLEADPNQLEEFLSKYEDALRSLRDKAPKYFQSIHIDPRTDVFELLYQNDNESDLFQHFIGLKYGFIQHLKMLGQSDNLKNYHIREFQMALRNPLLTKQLLGKNCADIPDCAQ
jgi:hypothetical protein